MHQFILFLEHASSEVQFFVITGMLLLCWNVEQFIGLSINPSKWKHAFVNAGFIFSNFPLQILVSISFAATMQWTAHHHFGLFYHFPFMKNDWVVFMVTFIFLDLGEYVYHVFMHRVKRLWMFHIVHHSDLQLDTSTSLREHPGENFIRNCFTLLWVFVSGTVFWALLLRQLIQIISNVFAHVNYRLPESVDRLVGLVFITPNLHHVHHHYVRPYTDCNYGDVLSVWDRMFGTFRTLSSSKTVFGVDTYMDEPKKHIYWYLLKLPFGKYRKSTLYKEEAVHEPEADSASAIEFSPLQVEPVQRV
ncbi:MAG: sterol desaturase family protein [Bacteroidetes bacterium]|nr:sterol desaturase family protein [Bacteroidota bacterium]